MKFRIEIKLNNVNTGKTSCIRSHVNTKAGPAAVVEECINLAGLLRKLMDNLPENPALGIVPCDVVIEEVEQGQQSPGNFEKEEPK